jgi:hypothetical protein
MAVFGDFQQIEDAEESGLECQCRSDVRKSYRFNGINLDLAFVHAITGADRDMGPRPDAHAASDFAATDSFPGAFLEDHEESLRVTNNAGKWEQEVSCALLRKYGTSGFSQNDTAIKQTAQKVIPGQK